MIDPKEFLNKNNNDIEIDDSVSVSGTFICQECNETVRSARLDEAKRKIVWQCSSNHSSEAKL